MVRLQKSGIEKRKHIFHGLIYALKQGKNVCFLVRHVIYKITLASVDAVTYVTARPTGRVSGNLAAKEKFQESINYLCA